jgi:hypothetical protein
MKNQTNKTIALALALVFCVGFALILIGFVISINEKYSNTIRIEQVETIIQNQIV